MADQVREEGDFDAAPVMAVVPAVVVRPVGFVLPPEAGQASIAFGASPAPNDGAMLCVAIKHADGEMLIAAVPDSMVADLISALVNAAEQVTSRRFAAPRAVQ